MPENSLIQFAQMITELPMHHHHPAAHHDPPRSEPMHRPLPVRKNACIVCCVCFTCSKDYDGHNCKCGEAQPRRGKNLPVGCLDSRAKKLHPDDEEDYDFSLKWLAKNAHEIYKDATGRVIGLEDLSEVSLCKAHSSTLYRAKKRHERSKNQAPPSPADSSTAFDDRRMARSPSMDCSSPLPTVGGGLAAKVTEMYHNQQARYAHPPRESPTSPDFSAMTASTSHKRKRTSKHPPFDHKPHSSASTPLYTNGVPPFLSHHHHPSSASSSVVPPSSRPHVDTLSTQLPPLHTRTTSLSSLSSSLQHQLQLSSPYQPNFHRHHDSAAPAVVETVSLKSTPAPDAQYYVRNLAITDAFTFRDLLTEIDMMGSIPPGKRIVVSDPKSDRIFPLDQAIRNVIRRPSLPHIELCLGLTDKPSIDWSKYT